MKLKDAQRLYRDCQASGAGAFIVRKHCWADYPERRFTQLEVLRLLLGKGRLADNKYPTAQVGSFLWQCRDDNGSRVEIAVVLEEGMVKAIAISAYRESKD